MKRGDLSLAASLVLLASACAGERRLGVLESLLGKDK